MPDGNDAITIRIADSLAAIDAEAWDACAGDDPNPFTRYGFLRALEDSGAVTAESGWMPQHLVVEDETGGISGCAPLYLKSHSYGEYVFDWAWAEAWDRAGGSARAPRDRCARPWSAAWCNWPSAWTFPRFTSLSPIRTNGN